MAPSPTSVPEVPMISLGDQLSEMVAPIRQALEQGERHVEYLEGLVKRQKAECAKMRRALSVIDPDYQSPQTKSRRPQRTRSGRSGNTGFGISIETAGPYAEKILELTKDGGYVTQPEVYQALGDANQTRCAAAFSFFREIGFVGKAGRDPGSRRERWRVLEPDAYQKALEAWKEQQ